MSRAAAAVVGFVTCGSRAEARRVAAALLTDKLAACVNIVSGLESHYWWQGKQEQAKEWLCVVKTTRARTARVIAGVRAVHSYELPEIIFMPIVDGERKYLNWLRAAVRLVALTAAVAGGALTARADAFDDMVRRLGAADPEERAEAADRLTALGGTRVEALFREMLRSPNPERRQLAAIGLLQVNDADENLKAVRALLDDENSLVRWSAALALGESGWVIALPWVQETAAKDSAESVREGAAEAVAKLRAVIPWRRSLKDGLAEATRMNRPVLLYFSLRGSEYCQRFEQGVLKDAAVVKAAQEFVPIWVDALSGLTAAQQFDVRGTPTTLVLDARGQELTRLAGLASVAELVAQMGEARRTGLTFREARRLAARDPANIEANWKVAETYLGDGREELAEPHLRNVVNHDPDNRSGRADDALFALGFVLGKKGEYAQGAYCLEGLLERHPTFKDRDKALFCLGLSRLAVGQRTEARQRLEQLTREFPNSAAAANARLALERLDQNEKQ